MQPRNAEVLRKIIDVQAKIMLALGKYKELVPGIKEEFQDKTPDTIHAIAVYHGIEDIDLLYPDSGKVLALMTKIDRMRQLFMNVRDGKIDEHGRVATSKHVTITFEEEPPKAMVPVSTPEEIPASPTSLNEVYAIIDAAIGEGDPLVMESFEEDLLDVESHAGMELKNVRRDGTVVKGELEYSGTWEGTIIATISMLRAFNDVTGTRLPDLIEKEIDLLENSGDNDEKTEEDAEE